jgi:hypothetical protein
LDFLDAEHDAFSRRGDPIVHRRRILFVKPRYWILVDDLVGTSKHQVDLTFQFAPLQVALGPDRWARVETPRGHALWVRPFTRPPPVCEPASNRGATADCGCGSHLR